MGGEPKVDRRKAKIFWPSSDPFFALLHPLLALLHPLSALLLPILSYYLLYYFSSSDHGFQLGEFNLPFDKRHVYDFDTRIHLLVRGPGVKSGSTLAALATNVDLAPTWLGLAGVAQPGSMDGRSLAPLQQD